MKNIEWSKIKTAHGFAAHIPEQILKLDSPAVEDRKKAYWQIDNYVILQSDLYESAYYVIDPLVKLLKVATHKQEILNLLIEIANGYAPDTVVIELDNGIKKTLIEACRDKLREYREDFLLLKDSLEKDDKTKELLNELIDLCED
jgi:hypothetical protein